MTINPKSTFKNLIKILFLLLFAGGLLFGAVNFFLNDPKSEVVSPLGLKRVPSTVTETKNTVILLATGDIIPARMVNIQTTKLNNFKWPFEKTADILRSGDITFIDLEAPIIKNCPLTNEGFVFCGDVRHLEGLLFGGIDVANVANNHFGNYGLEGINESVKLLKANGITVTGQDGPVFKIVNGTKFAFLGFNDIGGKQEGISWVDDGKLASEIQLAKENADVVVVQFHWGAEYRASPDDRQIYLAHLAIDSGADLVIGNHPHWIQPVEKYKNGYVTYAHGNFIFDQEWSLKTKQGVIGKYTFVDGKINDIEFIPIQIEDYGQPNFMTGKSKQDIIDFMMSDPSIKKFP